MNAIILISFLSSCSLLYGQDDGSEILTLTYRHGVKLNKIQEPGSKFMLKQLCTTAIDSIISSGNVTMQKSKIGKIKNCNYQWQIREDTLRTIIIETSKYKYTKQVIKQATSQFGDPTEIKNNQSAIYEWIKKTDLTNIKAKLLVDEVKGTGKMTITK